MNTIRPTQPIGIRLLLAAMFGLAWIQHAHASQDPRLETTVSQSSLQVAEPFWLDLTVEAPIGAKVDFPAPGEMLGGFNVLDKQDLFDIPSRDTDDKRTWTRRLRLESLVTGDLEIPSLEIQLSEKNASHVIRSEPIPIRIASVLEGHGDPTQIRDIQSVVDVAVPQAPSHAWVWWSIGSMSGLSVVVAAVALVARRRPRMSPADWATQQLDLLEQAIPTETAESGQLASRLATILRNYLQLEFSLANPGRSPDELLETLLDNHSIDDATSDQLSLIFALVERAQFAGLPVAEKQFLDAIDRARLLVTRIAKDSETNASPADHATTEAL
ncbi:hypothetical protein [Bremerella alba]|uniref:Protein BatD n=1 Tax=Bremerella alba TaxID=980252 RepID=A0A7V8V152_9BACT|nr:hypothetical protein [Bremerella alba]MBA2112954.1 hypothetical protein [Bremerella alba]